MQKSLYNEMKKYKVKGIVKVSYPIYEIVMARSASEAKQKTISSIQKYTARILECDLTSVEQEADE